MLTIDEALQYEALQFSVYQWLICFICAMVYYTQGMTTLMKYFVSVSPTWECVTNSSVCTSSAHFAFDNDLMCYMNRSDWKFTQQQTFSITTQFDLVCDKSWIISPTTSLFSGGSVFNGILVGWVADRFGRKNVCFITLGAILITELETAFCDNLIALLLLHFATWLPVLGSTVQVFVLLTENIGKEYRNFAGQLMLLVLA